jgi:hypothetical protein
VYGTVAPGGPGGGAYGAVCNDGFWAVCALVNCTLVGNSATGGAGGTGEPDGGTGTAQGGVGGATLVNTLLVADRPADVFTDHGRNLVSASASGVVGPLTNNGGPTLTMALLAGSPAIGQGNPGPAPSTDQRGIPRPVGVAVDIGAYQTVPSWPLLGGLASPGGGLELFAYGVNGSTVCLQTSTDLTNWVNVSSNIIRRTYLLNLSPGPMSDRVRFFRLAAP